MDIGAVMFFGGDGTYEFTNASLPAEYQVDESKIHRFEGYSIRIPFRPCIGDFAQIATIRLLCICTETVRPWTTFGLPLLVWRTWESAPLWCGDV